MSQTLKTGKHSILLDNEGFLLSLEDWTEQAAAELAKNEGINLGKEHWEILKLVRAYYQDYQSSPANRALVKYTGKHLGKEKGRSIYLMSLFPESPAKIACKIAGLPKPDNCL